MRKYIYSLLALVLVLALAACGGAQSSSATQPGSSNAAGAQAQKLSVVATIFPQYDFVRQIAGNAVELTMLLPPGSECHSFEPSPQDIITIQNCDVFICVGGNTDAWVDTILESMDTSAMTVVRLVDLVATVEEELVEGMQHNHDDHDHEDDHSHTDDEAHDNANEHDPGMDEHVWTSPVNAVAISRALCATLSGLDAANAALYETNTAAYTAQLEELHTALDDVVAGAGRTTLAFGDRFSFRYLAEEYGLSYYAAFPGCSTDTEASASTVAFLVNKVRDEAIPVVFHIELSNERMADTLCEETGAKKLLLHSCHNLTRDDFEAGETYLSLMWQNVENLKEALN